MTSESDAGQVHAHEILELVGSHDGLMTAEQLRERAASVFGAGARFFACFGEGLTIDELLPQLIERRKLALAGGRLHLCRQNVCS